MKEFEAERLIKEMGFDKACVVLVRYDPEEDNYDYVYCLTNMDSRLWAKVVGDMYEKLIVGRQ